VMGDTPPAYPLAAPPGPDRGHHRPECFFFCFVCMDLEFCFLQRVRQRRS
jgi:hypothetical protein